MKTCYNVQQVSDYLATMEDEVDWAGMDYEDWVLDATTSLYDFWENNGIESIDVYDLDELEDEEFGLAHLTDGDTVTVCVNDDVEFYFSD